MRTMLPDTWVNQQPPLWSALLPAKQREERLRSEWGGYSLLAEGRVLGPSGGRLSAPSSPSPQSHREGGSINFRTEEGTGRVLEGHSPFFILTLNVN